MHSDLDLDMTLNQVIAQQLCKVSSQSNLPRTIIFSYSVYCDFDLRNMPLGQDYDTHLGNGPKSCELSNAAVRGHDKDTGFSYTLLL